MGAVDASLLLTKKNLLLSLRDRTPLLITVGSTLFAMLVLYFSQLSINNGDSFDPRLLDTPDPESFQLPPIPRCVPWTFDDCLTLAYVGNDDRVSSWVKTVAENNDIPDNETRSFQSEDALNEYLIDNPNRTQAAYIFSTDSISEINDGNVRFLVQYNETEQFEFPLDTTDFHAAVVVPSMIHQMNLVLFPEVSNKQYSIRLNMSVYPHPNIVALNDAGGAGVDAFGQYGPLLTFAIYFLVLVFFLYKIIDEKERGLRDAMKLAGQAQYMHYVSWFVPFFLLGLVVSLLLIAFGHAFRFKYFTVHPFSTVFLTFFIFSLAVIGWTFLVATLVQHTTAVSSIAFTLFIFSYILATSASVVYQTDEGGEPVIGDNVLYLRQLFAILPSTMFVKALQDGAVLALQGQPIGIEAAGTYTDTFPIRDCWIWMLLSGLVAFVLSIYLDNVVPTSHGVPLSPFYFLQPSYWLPSKAPYLNLDSDASELSHTRTDGVELEAEIADPAVNSYDANREDVDVAREREAVANGRRDRHALVIRNVSRRFKNFQAVDDVSFAVPQNTAFALLGHNGAGKSTLFKMIVTALKPSGGDIDIYGLSVKKHPTQVRKLLGVCPQFDIFWDKLTGAEHIEVFAALKGLNKTQRRAEIKERLLDVQLTEKKDILAGQYSGGMQRRLSVALALTGDPKVVLLDECTSGADPLVRRELWSSIQRAKQGRVVFMITHSIAEAQHIAGHNRIGIMAKGKLRVLGNALHLKTKFGAGYKVLLVLRNNASAERIVEMLNRVCPDTMLLSTSESDSGGLLAEVALSRAADERQVLEAVSLLDLHKHELGITEYSLNSATLGEVFKSITSLSEDVNEDEHEGGFKKKKRFLCF